jgi:DNA-binding NarL/FixJ family response regulator
MHANAIYVRKAIEAGASAYILKSAASEELLKAVEIVRKGGTSFSPGLGQDVIDNIGMWPAKTSQLIVELTSRQREILQLISEGKQNKEIASLLNLSVKTIEFHRSRLMTKVGSHSVAELTRFAIREGLTSSTD